MKVSRKDLLSALGRAKAVAAGSGSVPILRQALVTIAERPDGLWLTISATDQETCVRIAIEAQGEADAAAFLVGIERPINFLRAETGAEVEVEVDGRRLVIEGLARATFPIEIADDYPTLPQVGTAEGEGIEIDERLAVAIRRAAIFTDKAMAMKYRAEIGVVFLWEEGGRVAVGASEWHALWAERDLAPAKEGWWCAIPREAALGIEPCRMFVGEGHLFFVTADATSSVRRPEIVSGDFIRSAISRHRDTGEVESVDLAALLAPLRSVAARVKGEERGLLTLRPLPARSATSIHGQGENGEAEAIAQVGTLPFYQTVFPGLLLSGLEELHGLAASAVTVSALVGGSGLIFDAGTATLFLTGFKG